MKRITLDGKIAIKEDSIYDGGMVFFLQKKRGLVVYKTSR